MTVLETPIVMIEAAIASGYHGSVLVDQLLTPTDAEH